MLAFEKPGGGSDGVPASKLAAILGEGQVPVVVLNACQSGAVGKDLESAVATRLLQEGCAAVVAMAYSVYAVAAAEFMAVFYERLFAGDTVSAAVTAGRRRLFEKDLRPSPKGDLPLADWLVPVHYLREEVRFPQAAVGRPAAEPSLDVILDERRAPGPDEGVGTGALDPVGSFVGRDDLFYQLEAAARLQRVAVLHGPGGTGKTELAKAFGRWWRDTGGVDRPDWLIWHSFEPGTASFRLHTVILETGRAVFGSDPVQMERFIRLDAAERRQVVERLLAEQRLLLIWDNFETVWSMPDTTRATPPLSQSECGEVKDFLARLAANGKSAVLITSRTSEDWLDEDWPTPLRRIMVGGLTRGEAAEYATKLLKPLPAARPRRERRAFGELLEWLDGHPLSMRLILPRLDTADPEALLDGLRGTTPLPGGDEGGDRTTSLAASITYSFAHLTSKTRRLLPAVGLFHGLADIDALVVFSSIPYVPDRFAGASRQEWEQALDDAARVGLLIPLDSGKYRIHPALPGYLAAQWRAEDPGSHDDTREAAIRALATAYAFVIMTFRQMRSVNAELGDTVAGLQWRTLRALLDYALKHQMWDVAEDMVKSLNDYWDARGLDDEATAWADRVCAATEAPDGSPPSLDTPAGSVWLFVITAHAVRQERAMRLEDAERTYRQILGMLQALPDSPEYQLPIAGAYHNLGNIALRRGRLAEAEDWYRKSLAISERLEDRPLRAASYHQLGLIAQEQGRLEDAEEWYLKSLAIEEDLGNRPGISSIYRSLGKIAQMRRRLQEAEEWYLKSLAIEEDLGNRPGISSIYHELGSVAEDRWRLEEQGRLEDAEEWYLKSLDIKEDLRDRPGMAISYGQLGLIAYYRRRLEEAEEWTRRTLAISEELGDRTRMAASYHQLGMIAQEQGRLEDAEEWYLKSLAIEEDLGNRSGMAMTYGQLGLLAEQRGAPGRALEWIVRCVTVFGEFPHPMTGAGPDYLAQLTVQLGMDRLEACWLEITSSPLPQDVRDYVNSRRPRAE